MWWSRLREVHVLSVGFTLAFVKERVRQSSVIRQPEASKLLEPRRQCTIALATANEITPRGAKGTF